MVLLACPASSAEPASTDDLSALSSGASASAVFDGGTEAAPISGLAEKLGETAAKTIYVVDGIMTPHQPFTRPASRVDFRPLREQAAQMDRDIRERFLAGDGKIFLYSRPVLMGDMAIWQGAYASMAVLRYDWDRSDDSRAQAEKAFDGLAMMYKPGLPLVRGILPDGMPADHPSGHYRREGGLQWSEDASVDSASGWLLGALIVARKLPSRRAEAEELIRRFARDVVEGGFRLRNGDGSATRLGNMGRGFFPPPAGTLISFAALNECAENFPDDECRAARDRFAENRKDIFASVASVPALGVRNVSTNHDIGFLGLTAALISEIDPERWTIFARGLVRLAAATEESGDSFWIYLSYWALEQRPEMIAYASDDPALSRWLAHKPAALALAKKPMQEFDYPRCKQAYAKTNSTRTDLHFVKWPLSDKKTVAQPLPIHERPAADFIWQRDQYALDDWGGSASKPAYEFNGMDFLFAYYLGLHEGGLNPRE